MSAVLAPAPQPRRVPDYAEYERRKRAHIDYWTEHYGEPNPET